MRLRHPPSRPCSRLHRPPAACAPPPGGHTRLLCEVGFVRTARTGRVVRKAENAQCAMKSLIPDQGMCTGKASASITGSCLDCCVPRQALQPIPPTQHPHTSVARSTPAPASSSSRTTIWLPNQAAANSGVRPRCKGRSLQEVCDTSCQAVSSSVC